MRNAEKIAYTTSALIVAGLVALAAPVAVSALSLSSPDEQTRPAPASAGTQGDEDADVPGVPDGYVDVGDDTSIPEDGPGACAASAFVSITGEGSVPDTAKLLRPENLEDTGPREFANGEVGYAEDGRIATYTVASGDSLWAVGDRLCIYNALALGALNGDEAYEVIQPGDVLVIDPAAVPDFEYEYSGT
ncbi:LysM peptidoglycan-binding domain-containing protein [Microbacterium aurantiacum]|uniref:LysM peptidoglycan-binding domain-containing protein n=1 Tax=Microbacterium aurantiacum TaxID=162393 RepID=UPI000A459D8C|nr:LysM domain-containing protein [Microbacterium chocolatum]